MKKIYLNLISATARAREEAQKKANKGQSVKIDVLRIAQVIHYVNALYYKGATTVY